MQSRISRWMVSDCMRWEYPDLSLSSTTSYVWPRKLDQMVSWMLWVALVTLETPPGALFPDDARHYRVDVLEVPVSERGILSRSFYDIKHRNIS